VKMLIIEDLESDLFFVKELLKELPQGLKCVDEECDSSSNLAEAEKKIADHEYDVILLDLNLPDCRGLETFQKLKESRIISIINASTPIIIFTGVDDFSIAKQALKLGAKDYLIKGSFGKSELERALHYATFARVNPKRKGWAKRLFL
jgi:YesN/AraC family two-component response regulator